MIGTLIEYKSLKCRIVALKNLTNSAIEDLGGGETEELGDFTTESLTGWKTGSLGGCSFEAESTRSVIVVLVWILCGVIEEGDRGGSILILLYVSF